VYDDGEEIPYCQRPSESKLLKRKKNECDNEGEKALFRDLIDKKIHPNSILKWSSSVEMADLYAALFYNRLSIDNNDDRFLCNCTKPGTFGKYCEYQLTHNARTLSHAIEGQFKEKKDGDSWNTQRYGKILCYETLPCHSGPLCLDWREICDGVQRCLNGIDEENWDKLEFNECEDDEFRCTNGMCISEQFWLDGKFQRFSSTSMTLIVFIGDFDCMDWSDEYFSGYDGWCSFEARSMECDEHLCRTYSHSCGDGECVQWFTRMAFQRMGKAVSDCFTKRNLNYMCEVSPHQVAWTLESGLCWPDEDYDDPRYPPWNIIDTSELSNDEKCLYLFRCAWSKGFEHDCPCNHRNCTEMLMNVCRKPDHLIFYPPQGLIDPNLLFAYDYRQPMENPQFKFVGLHGNLRCQGFFGQVESLISLPVHFDMINTAILNHLICNTYRDFSMQIDRNYSSSFQNDLFCWNDSLTFNGRRYAVYPDICFRARQCISQYRIHDSNFDCISGQDELTIVENSYCTGNVGRQRFQCFNDQHKCLRLDALGTGSVQCSNKYDESYFGTGASLQTQLQCQKSLTAECHRVKEYIQRSSSTNSSNNTQLIDSPIEEQTNEFRFQLYCDSFWDLKKHLDEIPSSCQYWVCQHDQYQCQTGQCIQLNWVCDGEWDCADASDEEGIELIKQWSYHNAALSGLFSQVEKCGEIYSKSPFSEICNRSFELGCYRSEVENPLDIRFNRPCINLTQIGDGVEDCFNAYDERNTFIANSEWEEMWGFHFRCKGTTKRYVDACNPKIGMNCSEILCSFHRNEDGSCSDIKDWICLEDDHCQKGARCNRIVDCKNGEDEYWCPTGSLPNQIEYRFDKKVKGQSVVLDLPTFPGHFLISDHQDELKRMINSESNSSSKIHSYQCNRGVAVLESNETQCLCPPAYYGRWCEFYSDRISVIAHLDHSTLPKTVSNITLKIKANFLYNNRTIDQHQFNVIPTFEKSKIIKHRFYLLYSRSKEMIEHKRNRYFNRTDVITHHPYSVRFDVFVLEENRSVKELGSWHYPIYFDYLPAFRLAIILKFPSWFGNVTIDPCRQSDCNENSTCLPVFNQNNSYYCSCKNGYYGRNCGMYESQCNTSCSVDGFCEVNSLDLQVGEKEISCICPFGHFGSGCNLKYDQCDQNSCLNNGICFPTYDQSGEEPFVCNCSERFEGKRCEIEKPSVHVHLNMTGALSAYPTVVQLYNYIHYYLQLHIQYQQVYRQLPSVIEYYGIEKAAPSLGILKIYEHWSNPQYFVMYTYAYDQWTINITSSPQLCPHALSLLSKGQFREKSFCFTSHESFTFRNRSICSSGLSISLHLSK
jgi:hypothetical protein